MRLNSLKNDFAKEALIKAEDGLRKLGWEAMRAVEKGRAEMTGGLVEKGGIGQNSHVRLVEWRRNNITIRI